MEKMVLLTTLDLKDRWGTENGSYMALMQKHFFKSDKLFCGL